MKNVIGVAQTLNRDLLVRKHVFNASGGVGEVCDGDHHRRRWGFLSLPALAGFFPIVTEDGVCSVDEVGQRDVRFYFAVDVVLDAGVGIDVIEA